MFSCDIMEYFRFISCRRTNISSGVNRGVSKVRGGATVLRFSPNSFENILSETVHNKADIECFTSAEVRVVTRYEINNLGASTIIL